MLHSCLGYSVPIPYDTLANVMPVNVLDPPCWPPKQDNVEGCLRDECSKGSRWRGHLFCNLRDRIEWMLQNTAEADAWHRKAT